MSKESFDLKQGIKAHVISTDLYKTNMICVIITVPLDRENVTKNALIPFMLRRGTQKHPDQYILNRELEKMYGATFDCGIDKTGDNQILKFYIDTVNNDYTLDKENILEKSIDMILEIVFNPVLENGKLKEEFLKVEKDNLKRVIESKIDDKDTYSLEACVSSMYGEKGYGLYKYGYVEDIENININDLSNHYFELIQNAKIDIFLSGNFEAQDVKDILEKNENIKKLKPRIGNYILNNEFTESKQKVENYLEISENMNITQGKLVLGLDILSKMENLRATALVYNAILGDGASSMLFQNVREKAGLAYSTRSKFIKQKLNIFIRCGIQIEDYEKALSLIKEQLENIKSGSFSDEDILNAKSYLVSGIKAIKEEQDSEIVFYLGQEISKRNITIEEYIEQVENVSKEEIMSFAKDVQINTVYFLRN